MYQSAPPKNMKAVVGCSGVLMLNFRRLVVGTGIYWDKGRAYVLVVVINRSAGGCREEVEAVRCQESPRRAGGCGVSGVRTHCFPVTPRRLNTAIVHKDTAA